MGHGERVSRRWEFATDSYSSMLVIDSSNAVEEWSLLEAKKKKIYILTL